MLTPPSEIDEKEIPPLICLFESFCGRYYMSQIHWPQGSIDIYDKFSKQHADVDKTFTKSIGHLAVEEGKIMQLDINDKVDLS